MAIQMGVSKESIKSPEPLDEDLYTLRIEGFKPDRTKKGDSINYNPQLKVVKGEATADKFAGKPFFESLNATAGWIQNDFVHAAGLEMVAVTGDPDALTIPGEFNGDPSNPRGWVYSGPLVGKELQLYVVKSQNPDTKKFFNQTKYYVCKVKDCNTRFPDMSHSKNLIR